MLSISHHVWGIEWGRGSQQIYYLLVINLNERYFKNNGGLLFSLFYLHEYLPNHSWDDTIILLIQCLAWSSAHGVSFAAASLSIGEHSSIVALEAGQNQITHTSVVHLHLHSFLAKHLVENKASVLAYNDLIILQVFDAAIFTNARLFAYNGADPQGHPHSVLHAPFLFGICLHLCLHHPCIRLTPIIIIVLYIITPFILTSMP